MMWNVRSYLGVGEIEFGMKPAQVRRATNLPHEAFQRAEESTPSDFFPNLGMFAYYDQEDTLKALEFAPPPAQPEVLGVKPLGSPFAAFAKLVEAADPLIEFDDDGFTSRALGIGAYAPAWKKSRAPSVEGLIAFRNGYYD